ncbi:MAG: thioesterase superfamily protein [Saprospiraceae bacterium]|nr:MAG: thioesterase superfamily protein [Saprospiraceae bacterium]
MKQPFDPPDPDFANRIKESFSNQKFMSLIGAKLVDVQPGYCEIHLPFRDDLTQQHGYFHAAVTTSIADSGAGYAAFTLMPTGHEVLSVEFKVNLLTPGQGKLLIAKAYVLKTGRTLTVCRADVFVIKDGQEKLCAAAQVTLISLKPKVD